MKKISDVAPAYAKDLKKRASRCFGNGDITKQELDTVCDHLDAIIKILGGIGKAGNSYAEQDSKKSE